MRAPKVCQLSATSCTPAAHMWCGAKLLLVSLLPLGYALVKWALLCATKSCRVASSRSIFVRRLSPSEMTCVAAYFSFLLKPRALTPMV